MKIFLKRLNALAISLVLAFALVPAVALAEGTDENTQSPTTETEPGPVVTEKVYTDPVFVGKVKVTKNGSKIRKVTIPKIRFTINKLNAQTKEVISTKKSDAYGMKVEVNVPNKGWKKASETDSGKYYSFDAGSKSYIQAIRISYNSSNKLSSRLKQAGVSLYYQAKVQNFGKLGWAKIGSKAGTTGQACAMTKLKLKLAASAPGSTDRSYFTAPSVKYQVRYKGKSAWTGKKKDGATAGKESWNASISGLSAKLSNKEYSGGIKYKVRCSKKEGSKYWASWAANGKKTNTSKKSKVQAISMKLTGKMAKMYDVYYRVYCGDHHWLGWAKNGQLTGSKKINYPIGGVQVELVAKGCAAPGSTKGLMRSKLPTSNGGELSMLRRAQSYSSGTNYLILVNRGAHRVAVFTGSKGNWKLKRYWSCVTGKPSTPTITGTFHTTGLKLGHLPDWSNARYATHIYGGYYFHTTLSGSWELGSSASHGCIRIAVSNAIWVYNNIPGGTTVNIYN